MPTLSPTAVQSTSRPPASTDTNKKATTTSSPSVAITGSAYLNTPAARDRFLTSLENTRKRYHLDILGYVVMPEHVHLLVGEPETKPLANALQALKLSVSKLSTQRPFWQVRYHDFNVLTHNKRVEKLHYMHQNPVTRGLVSAPEDWPGPRTATTISTNPA